MFTFPRTCFIFHHDPSKIACYIRSWRTALPARVRLQHSWPMRLTTTNVALVLNPQRQTLHAKGQHVCRRKYTVSSLRHRARNETQSSTRRVLGPLGPSIGRRHNTTTTCRPTFVQPCTWHLARRTLIIPSALCFTQNWPFMPGKPKHGLLLHRMFSQHCNEKHEQHPRFWRGLKVIGLCAKGGRG